MTIFLDSNQREYKKPDNAKVDWRISAYPMVRRVNEILMVIPTWNNLWELPGGGVHVNEKITDGMIRECYEETGYKIAAISDTPLFVGEANFFHSYLKEYFHSLIIVYESKLVSNEPDQNKNNKPEYNEIAKVAWVSLDEVNAQNCHPVIWPAIEKIK